MRNIKDATVSMVTLLSSFSTLFCCVLPALLISLGAGAVMMGLASDIPQLVWLSIYKSELFIFSGIMLTISGLSIYKFKKPCLSRDDQVAQCAKMRKFSKIIFWMSLSLYFTGLSFHYISFL